LKNGVLDRLMNRVEEITWKSAIKQSQK
jgi:hypothetical protein